MNERRGGGGRRWRRAAVTLPGESVCVHPRSHATPSLSLSLSLLFVQGGRHTPFVVNYKPQFFMRTADVTGTVTSLKEGAEMVMPGAYQRGRSAGWRKRLPIRGSTSGQRMQ
jgi:hypothetical protein